ncbi:MAG TPA: peptidylprolyl isomerase [Gemmatimonadota bacterium]|nr:peptidylprolyl isomerase [Gemmatimonadota bacterium]
MRISSTWIGAGAVALVGLAALGWAGCSGGGSRSGTTEPPVPDTFRVRFETSAGSFTVLVHRAWAPRGAVRFYRLVRAGYFDGNRFFRVIPGFVAQFGVAGDTARALQWRRRPIRDDPVRKSNTRGTLTFASAGNDTRTSQVFINLSDNARLDRMGFAPFGEVVEGMGAVDSIYSGYGETAPDGKGPDPARMFHEGNAYLEKDFPKLDSIRHARLLGEPAATPGEASGATDATAG